MQREYQYLSTPSGTTVSTTAIHEAGHAVIAYILGIRPTLDLKPADDSPGRCWLPGLDDLPLAARQMIACAGALANLASTQMQPRYDDIYGRMSPGDRALGEFTSSADPHFRCACRAVDGIFAAEGGFGWNAVILLAEQVEARRVLKLGQAA